MTSIAVIGCGVSGSAFLNAYVQSAEKKKLQNVSVDIFNKNSEFGKGLAFGSKACAIHKINMRALTMSIDSNNLEHFLKACKH